MSSALVWAVAPGLSLTPLQPQVREFSQPVPDPGSLPAIGGSARSDRDTPRTAALDAPARFDLVGVSGGHHPVLEMRAREDGGEWSSWRSSPSGELVWFGGGDQLQLRGELEALAGEQIHYFNVSGDSTLTDRALTTARGALNTAVLAVAGTGAEANPPGPAIVSRREWGANQAKGGCHPTDEPILYGKVKAASVSSTLAGNDYSEEQAPGIVLAICRFHVGTNGWNDIGYNLLADRFGNVYTGRKGGNRKAVHGAHAQGYNRLTTGIAIMGDHADADLPRPTRRALIKLLAWKMAIHEIPAEGHTNLRSAGGEGNKYPSRRAVRVKRIFPLERVNYVGEVQRGLKKRLKKIRPRVEKRIAKYGGDGPKSSGGTGSGR